MLSNTTKLLAVLGLAALILVPTSTSWAQQGAQRSHPPARAQARTFDSNAALNPGMNSRPMGRSSGSAMSSGDWVAMNGAGG